MASVLVSEQGIAPWAYGLGLLPGATLGTLANIDNDIINQLFKYQTFLKKCEDAMIAQGMTVLTPITSISNKYTARYTPDDIDTFKAIPMNEDFAAVGGSYASYFATIWQRFYEYKPAAGGKLYVRLDFGIQGRPPSTSQSQKFEYYQTSAWRITVASGLGVDDLVNPLNSRIFPHTAQQGQVSYAHQKYNLTTDFFFAATKNTVFFGFGGYRLSRVGIMDGRLPTASIPSTLMSGAVLAPFDMYRADVPKTVEAGLYLPALLGSQLGNNTPDSSLTCATPGYMYGSGTQYLAKVVLSSGTYSTANTGVMCTELRTSSDVGRIYGMPFTMAIQSGLIVAHDFMVFTDPDISSMTTQEYPFYVGETQRSLLRIPCINQTIMGREYWGGIAWSYTVEDTFRAPGQTQLGVLLDEAVVRY